MRIGLTILFALLCIGLNAQNVVLSGQVKDAQTGEPLIGVSVYNSQRRTGTTTNATGHYTLTLPSNRALELVFSYVGYASHEEMLTLTSNRQLDVELRQDTQNLHEVQVYGTRHNFGAQSSQMSTIAMSAEQIKQMPTLFGEVDVLKSLQKLPGVQSSSEGRAGIYVRGGDYDQNLFLLDGITLYNPEHLQGFTSAINADVMDDVIFYKGAFPARFGSRLSSIVDVGLREGDMQHYHASVTAGMLSSRIQAEGPVWKGHTSFNVATRISYFGAIVKPLLQEVIYDNPGQMDNYSHMKYFDLNAKLVHRFSESDRLSAVLYLGSDANNDSPPASHQHFELSGGSIIDSMERSRTVNQWKNLLGGLHFTHDFSSSLHLNADVNYSGYNYKLGNDVYASSREGIDKWGHGAEGAELYSNSDVEKNMDYRSKIHDVNFKAELYYLHGDRHEVHGGIWVGWQQLSPTVGASVLNYQKTALSRDVVWNVGLGDDRYEISEDAQGNELTDKRSLDTFSAYLEDDWEITDFLKANVGFRLQGYHTEGKTRLSAEPRISLRALVTKNTSVKAAYARMSQGIFLLSSGNILTPAHIWVPLNRNMDLGISEQLSFGVGHDFVNGLQLSVEGYYKWLSGVVDYNEGFSYINVTGWDDLVAQGKGRAYGVEFMAQKTIGTTTGMVSYTWSKALRTFDRDGMVLNSGREFYALGDRRHNFNINITQRLSKNWDFSAAWTYQSGRRATFASYTIVGPVLDQINYFDPMSEYYQDTYLKSLVRTNTYGQRNNFILPASHRLDVSLRHHGSIGIGEMICDIGIYNLYNQQNISTVYWGYDHNRYVLKGVCTFPIMPSLSLTLKL